MTDSSHLNETLNQPCRYDFSTSNSTNDSIQNNVTHLKDDLANTAHMTLSVTQSKRRKLVEADPRNFSEDLNENKDERKTPAQTNGTIENYSSRQTCSSSSAFQRCENNDEHLYLSEKICSASQTNTQQQLLAVLPLAPSLEEYFKNDGYLKYAPRPEWCHFSNVSANILEKALDYETLLLGKPAKNDNNDAGVNLDSGPLQQESETNHLYASSSHQFYDNAAYTSNSLGQHCDKILTGHHMDEYNERTSSSLQDCPAHYVNQETMTTDQQSVTPSFRSASQITECKKSLKLPPCSNLPISRAAFGSDKPSENECNTFGEKHELQQSTDNVFAHQERNLCHLSSPQKEMRLALYDDHVHTQHEQTHVNIEQQQVAAAVHVYIPPTVECVRRVHNENIIDVEDEQTKASFNSGEIVDLRVIQMVERAVSVWRKRENLLPEHETQGVHFLQYSNDRKSGDAIRYKLHGDNNDLMVRLADRGQFEGRQSQCTEEVVEEEIAADEINSDDSINAEAKNNDCSNDKASSRYYNCTMAVYGFDYDSALHLAIKYGPLEAALALIDHGANVDFPNMKGVTPLMTASLEGKVEVVRALLQRGANPNAVTLRGSNALIQACHFGQLNVAEELINHGALIEQANYKNTTALMRASQEGHEDVVKLLLGRNALVNRRNDEKMSALMLCSQRGHAKIVKILISAGAEVDALTIQNSTSLMLAIKRKHFEVSKILVASGTELMLKDSKNRSVLETARKRGLSHFAKILTSSAQVRLMKEECRKERNFCMVRFWHLLQLERACIRVYLSETTVQKMAENLEIPMFTELGKSKQALIRTMLMPAPVMELISCFLPLPLLWEKRLQLLTNRSHVDPDSAVYDAMDLIDEILEEGGLLEAFDAVGVAPPASFTSWAAFRSWCRRCDVILARCDQESSEASFVSDPSNVSRKVLSSTVQRRTVNYLQVLANSSSMLSNVITSPPFQMPNDLLEKLKSFQDVQSVVRRLTKGGGVHFNIEVANEIILITKEAVIWCESLPSY